MTRAFVVALLLCASSAGQSAAPISASEVPQLKEIFKNNRVSVSRLDLPAGDATPMHKHDRDMVTVVVSGDRIQQTLSGKKPTSDKPESGDVKFKSAGLVHATKNVGSVPYVAVAVAFLDAQGKVKNVGKKSHTCAPDKDACVEEKELFCTEKVCVEDVVMAPQSMSVKHSHSTDHMLIAISDYQLTDEVEGKGTVVRSHTSGEIEYIPAGITHQLKNTGSQPAHFAVILWK